MAMHGPSSEGRSSSEIHVRDGRFRIRCCFRMAQMKRGRQQNQTSHAQKKKKQQQQPSICLQWQLDTITVQIQSVSLLTLGSIYHQWAPFSTWNIPCAAPSLRK